MSCQHFSKSEKKRLLKKYFETPAFRRVPMFTSVEFGKEVVQEAIRRGLLAQVQFSQDANDDGSLVNPGGEAENCTVTIWDPDSVPAELVAKHRVPIQSQNELDASFKKFCAAEPPPD